MDREEICKQCKIKFYTDSKWVDKYCGYCRIEYYELIKQLRGKIDGSK